jgi:hypothetical protein
MSLETGGTHPLAREPDIQLDKELSVNLLDVRVGVIGNQIVLILVDQSPASCMQHGMGAGRTTRHSTTKRVVMIEMEKGFKGRGQMGVRAWAWARWRRRRFFRAMNRVFTQHASFRHLYSTG